MPADAPTARLAVGIGVAGAVGALARSGLATAWPAPPGGFPWATWTTNLSGCLLIGVLAVLAHGRPRVRAVLGTGLLGGYTTFSAYTVETLHLEPWPAAAYVLSTVAGAVAAAWAGASVTRRLRRR